MSESLGVDKWFEGGIGYDCQLANHQGETVATDTAEKPTLTVEEASALASVGINQMYQAVREGTIPSLRIGRRILIPRKKFMAMLEGEAA